MKKGTVIGTFKIRINCNLKSDINHFALDEFIEEIFEFIPNIDIDTYDVDVDSDESFILDIFYKNEGTYISYEGDRINPPECETNYNELINEKEFLDTLTKEYPEYSFKVDVLDYPTEESYD